MMRGALLAFGIACAGGAAVAQCDGNGAEVSTFSDAEWRGIEALTFLDRHVFNELLGSVSGREMDLNGDGQNELCVYASTSGTCSNGIVVCAAGILGGAARDKVLLNTSGHAVRAGTGRTNDWQDIEVIRAAADGNAYVLHYTYAADSYAAGASEILCSWSEETCGDQLPL